MQAARDAFELDIEEQAADLLDEFLRLAEIDALADAIFKIAEREIRTETHIAMFSPRGDYRALAGKKC